jgi:hypothetical protein
MIHAKKFTHEFAATVKVNGKAVDTDAKIEATHQTVTLSLKQKGASKKVCTMVMETHELREIARSTDRMSLDIMRINRLRKR